MTEQIDATNATEHMADAESTAESAKAAVRGVEETHPEYMDFAVDDFPGGLPACLEAILMVADQPQTATELARILALDRNTVEEALRALHDDYEGDESRDIRPRGFELRRTARGWQFASRAAFEPVVSSFVTDGQTARLSQAALEALLDLLGGGEDGGLDGADRGGGAGGGEVRAQLGPVSSGPGGDPHALDVLDAGLQDDVVRPAPAGGGGGDCVLAQRRC